jgi:hypothetical protein
VVLLVVHLLARFLTTLVDLAQLEPAQQTGGRASSVLLRSVCSRSVWRFNLLVGYSDGAMPPKELCAGSALYGPVRHVAPLVVPALGETKWVKDAVDVVKREVEERLDEREATR